ncbi:MAG: alkaline phosphatase D family protein [Verrucomicrobiota bacterium]
MGRKRLEVKLYGGSVYEISRLAVLRLADVPAMFPRNPGGEREGDVEKMMKVCSWILNFHLGRMLVKSGALALLLLVTFVESGHGQQQAAAASAPFQGMGLKVGEVGPTTAVVWTRLTSMPRPEQALKAGGGLLRLPGKLIPIPNPDISGKGVGEMSAKLVAAYSIPGADGEARVVYWPEAGAQTAFATEWQPVLAISDHTRQFALSGLQPGTRYRVRVEARPPGSDELTSITEGFFRTAPAPEQPARVVFTVITGQKYDKLDDKERGFKIYPAMAALDPDFLIHTGDIVYYDRFDLFADNINVARTHWHRMYSLPNLVDFHNQYNSYFMKDDHDLVVNDCWPGAVYRGFTFEQGQAVFLEQVPMSDKTYRTFRWGKDLQIWLTEGRDFRSPNPDPDGPNKTIWGAAQKEWFKRTVQESDATFRILINATPMVGPDRPTKNDSHANKGFQYESRELREFISQQKNFILLCGDRHWQYVSEGPEFGVREYSCGPVCDKHAGGTLPIKTSMHRFMRVKGGFLSTTVERVNGVPTAFIRHHAVDGRVVNEEVVTAE